MYHYKWKCNNCKTIYRLDGTGRVSVKPAINFMSVHPFSVAVFEDTIYWSDYGIRDIQSCHKFTGENHKVVVKSARIQTYGIQIAHELLQPPYWSPCNKMRYVQGRWNKWCRLGSVV